MKQGRKQAQRKLKLQKETAFLDKENILHTLRSKRNLGEAAGADKTIRAVIQNREDLIEIIIRPQPLDVAKGQSDKSPPSTGRLLIK